ncbi:unnamed protein product [Clavelina lepadiformis]|uniref:Uncharacterized protein n=1 Tax=Clavelina lepadiformis TaxID=159417 RepID=A0ABP0GYW7_CLALP
MKTISFVIALLSVGFVSATDLSGISEENIAYLTELSQSLIDEPSPLPIGQRCFHQTDCPSSMQCENVEGALVDAFSHTTHETDMQRVKRKAKIDGKECMRSVFEVTHAYPKDVIVERIAELLQEMNKIFEDAGVEVYGSNVTELVTSTLDNVHSLSAPLTKVADVAPVDPLLTIMLVLATRGNGGSSSIDATTLILLSLLQTQQPVGYVPGSQPVGYVPGSQPVDLGSNIFNNPFLLYILLNDNDSGSSSDLLLYLILLGGGSQLGIPRQGDPSPTNPSTNAFLSPFIIFALLDDSGSDSNLILLYLMTQGGLGGGTGGAGGLGSLLPILLLSNSSLGGSLTGGDNNLLTLLLLTGGLGGGGDTGGLGSLLPILLLGDSTIGGGLGGDDSLLTLLLLSGGLGGGGGYGDTGGLGSVLPILLLTNSSLGGGLTGGDDSLLTLLLLSGGLGGGGGYGDTGGLGSLLPILLLTNSSLGGGLTGGDDSLLTLLLLSGGLGGAGGINPLFLLQLLNVTDTGIDPILLLALSGGLGGGGTDPSTGVPAPTTGGFDINSLLPFILISDSGSSNSVLLLYLLSFAQNSANTQPPLDPNVFG